MVYGHPVRDMRRLELLSEISSQKRVERVGGKPSKGSSVFFTLVKSWIDNDQSGKGNSGRGSSYDEVISFFLECTRYHGLI